jgi:hypothetical protein
VGTVVNVTNTEELLTPPQVGRVLGLETFDVLVLMDSGDLPRVKGDDGMVYVPLQAVQAYAESQH